jgi:CHRD domain
MRLFPLIGTAALCAAGIAANASAQTYSARLSGFHEVIFNGTATPPTLVGAIHSYGEGALVLELDEAAKRLYFNLTYQNVGTTPPGTGTVTQAHIHFGQKHTPGGIMVFFCTNLTPPPGPMPKACPPNEGTVRGIITPGHVQGLANQNIAAGDFDALVDALRTKTAYANIHTTAFPAGEIRGQINEGTLEENDKKQHERDDHDHR